jgi:ankyrin repeat protein
MSRIELESPERKAVALTTLSWIYYAKRPLSVGELQHALAVDPSMPTLNEEDIPSYTLILDVCVGLVVLDTESGVVRFAHYSVHEYFQATCRHWFPLARKDITRTCLAYLGLNNLTYRETSALQGASHVVSAYPFLRYAAQNWGRHARDAYDNDMDEIALRFLEDGDRVVLAARMLEQDDGGTGRATCMDPCANLAVQLAARFGALEVIKLLLQRAHRISGTDEIGRTALHWAAWGGFVDVVTTILLAGGLKPDAMTGNRRTPLQWAAKHGHAHVVSELIRRGANPAEPTADGRSALHWAASRGHRPIVQMLLADDRVDAGCQSINGWTALHWAACSGNRLVVVHEFERDGLSRDRSPASQERVSMSGGESKGHEAVAALLLEAGVCPRARNNKGRTALHWAAASGNKEIIRLLRRGGAEVDALDAHGKTPRDFAVHNGQDDSVVAMLSGTVNS